MLTAELVVARRHKGELRLRNLVEDEVPRAVELANELVRLAHAHVGESREALTSAWDALTEEQLDRRVVLGLRKLVLDACTFTENVGRDPVELRRVLFTRAAERRLNLAEGEVFEREAVLVEVATELGMETEALESRLFADLKDAETLEKGPALRGEAFVAELPRAQQKAALLRATRATCTVRTRDAGRVRAFFRTLKFHKLLFEVEATGEGAFVVRVDGPFSLFEAVTRYGLGFAMLLSALEALGDYALEAEVLWGKERTPLLLKLEGESGATPEPETRVADDVDKLREALAPLCEAAGAKVSLSAELVNVPGAGLVVPDLTVKRGKKKVFVEVLGFWSRDAVWKRVELVERGMGERLVFCASERLRVSEAVMPDDLASLYVFKGVPSARKVMDRVLRLLER